MTKGIVNAKYSHNTLKIKICLFTEYLIIYNKIKGYI